MRVPSTKIQNNFGQYLKYLEVNEEIIVTKKGKDVAKLIPFYSDPYEYFAEEAIEYRASGKWVTYEQFLELTENSEQRYELIDGVIYYMASPSYKHQVSVGEIYGSFYNWFKNKKCIALTSPFDITLTKTPDNINVVQPDIVVICDKENIDKKGKYKGVPTLAVEILSPSTRSKDMTRKLDLFRYCEVKEYWIVDLENEQVYIYTFEKKDITDNKVYKKDSDKYAKSVIFEGLIIPLDDIFI